MIPEQDEHSCVETCINTGKPVCRRMFNMNLAMGYVEEVYILDELAKMHKQSREDLFAFAFDYVMSRDCFKKEWFKQDKPSSCPLIDECAFNKCYPEAQ